MRNKPHPRIPRVALECHIPYLYLTVLLSNIVKRDSIFPSRLIIRIVFGKLRIGTNLFIDVASILILYESSNYARMESKP